MYSKLSIVISVILVTAAILTVQSSMLQPSYAQLDVNSQNAILDMHNEERTAVGVPPVTWSNSLATDAQNWANYLASLNLRPYRPPDPGDIPPHSDFETNGRQGENLAWGARGFFSAATLAQGWANEKSNYVPGTPVTRGLGLELAADGSRVYGHYTQMVWRSTTQIGCGMASDANQDYLVCRYLPAGNARNQAPY
jgi:Cysteine-rich secretory protein family